MAAGVSASVRSIIDAFVSGFDVLSKIRDRQQRRQDRKDRSRRDEPSAQLSRSLRQGSQEVGFEYQRGMQGIGEAYARGDGIAQHSLTEILLKLNTGLVTIIASFLDNDHRRADVDYGALTHLSERSRRDSLQVLRQLYRRTSSSRRVPAQIRSKDSLAQPALRMKQKKIRGPTIARVTIEASSKRSQLAVVKPGVKRKSPSSSTSNLSKSKSYSSSTTAVDSVASKSSPRLPDAKAARQSTTALVKPQETRRAAQSSPNLLPERVSMPGLPDSVPSTPRPHVPQRRKTTPTMYSIATDSTKLGEIPMHKWTVPYDFDEQSLKNRQAMQNGWPLRDLDGNAVVKPKRRFGLFRLFKRRDVAEAVY